MPEGLAISTEAASYLIVTGEIDLATAPELEVAIPLSGSVWLDFSAVTFLDSSGIAVLVKASRAATGRGDRIHVSGLQGGPLRVVQLTGLWDVLCGD